METPEELGLTDVSFMIKSGVYVLVSNGEVVYVGQSVVLADRIGAHTRNMKFDSVYIVNCEASDMQAVEIYLIDLYRPIYNINLNPIINQLRGPRGKADRPLRRSGQRITSEREERTARWIHYRDGTIELSADDMDDINTFIGRRK